MADQDNKPSAPPPQPPPNKDWVKTEEVRKDRGGTDNSKGK